MSNGVLNPNGKRAGDIPRGERHPSMAKLSHDGQHQQQPLSVDITYQLKILANVDPKVPFFTETAQGVIDTYALKNTISLSDLEVLQKALKDQGADKVKIDAANAIWKESVDLQVLREIASRLTTAEAAEAAVRAFISGLKEHLGANVTSGRENALLNNVKACYTGNYSYREENARHSGPSTSQVTADHGFNASSAAVAPPEATNSSSSAAPAPASVPQPSERSAELPARAARFPEAAPFPSSAHPAPTVEPFIGSHNEDSGPRSAGGVDLAEIDRLIKEGQTAASTQSTPAKAVDAKPAPLSANQDDLSRLKASLISPFGGTNDLGSAFKGAANQSSPPHANGNYEREPHRSSQTSPFHNKTWPTGPRKQQESYIKQEPGEPDHHPLADRVSGYDKVPKLEPSQMTCWFWFQQDHCNRGAHCIYQHTLLDYVAEYKPNSYSRPFRIIKRDNFEDTKRLTIAAMRGAPIPKTTDARAYDPYERPAAYEQPRPSSYEKPGAYDQPRPKTAASFNMGTYSSLAKSETPIVDALCDGMPITLGGRDEMIKTILRNIKARRNQSSKDFVTQLFDASGKYTGYSIENHDGLYSKLAGMWANARNEAEFDQVRVRRLIENMLRPFVVANKSKFLDLPGNAFSPHKTAEVDRERSDSGGSAANGFRNWSQKF